MRFSLFLQSTAKSNVGYDFPLSYTLIYYYFFMEFELINKYINIDFLTNI